MESMLKEQLGRAILRFRKIGVLFPAGLDVHMGELVVLKSFAEGTGAQRDTCLDRIQDSLRVSKPAISQMLNSLEKKGLIRRDIDKRDRRKIKITLTPKGIQVMCAMREHTDRVLLETINRMGEKDTGEFIALFNRFADITDQINRETLENRGGILLD